MTTTTRIDDQYLTRSELAERLQLPVSTLAKWAHEHTGPRYTKFGRGARYRLSDVISWENKQFVSPDKQLPDRPPIPDFSDEIKALPDGGFSVTGEALRFLRTSVIWYRDSLIDLAERISTEDGSGT
jgi:hypothetical protein